MKRHFTAEEVQDLFFEGDITQGENRRWNRYDSSLVEVDGKFYILGADIGLTECQEDTWEAQDCDEVELVKETIVVQTWKVKE